MRSTAPPLVAAIAALAACEAGPVTHGAAPVTSGAAGGDPAVVAITDGDGELHCSGTLIGPRTVLSAAHCSLGPVDVASMQVFFGDSLAGGGESIDICSVEPHPQFVPATFASDLLLVHLERDAPVAPLPMHPGPLDTTLVGADLEVTGFGRTAVDADDSGARRTGTGRMVAVTDLEIEIEPGPAQPCVGDSGGAALLTEDGVTRLAAVISHGDAGCIDHAYLARVDVALAAFLEPGLGTECEGGCSSGGSGSALVALLLFAHGLRRRTTKRPMRASSR